MTAATMTGAPVPRPLLRDLKPVAARRLLMLLAVVCAAVSMTVVAPAVAGVEPQAQAAPVPPSCLSPLTRPQCVKELAGKAKDAAGNAVQSAASSVLKAPADDAAKAAAAVLRESLGWWLRTPSVRVGQSGVVKVQAALAALSMLVMTLLVIIQGLRVIIQRRGAPLAELIKGLMVAAVVTTIGVATIDAALIASDQMALWILEHGFDGPDRLMERVNVVLFGSGITGQTPMLLLVFAVVVLLVGMVQAVMLFLRQAGIPIMAAVLPFASAGQAGPPSTQQWLPRLGAAIGAIVFYKPLVAIILAVGFSEIASGSTLLDAIRGFVTLVLSVIALPALLQLFSPISSALASRSGGGGGALLAAGSSAASVYAIRGSGVPGDTSAVQQASFMAGWGSRGEGGAGTDAPGASDATRAAASTAQEGQNTTGTGPGGADTGAKAAAAAGDKNPVSAAAATPGAEASAGGNAGGGAAGSTAGGAAAGGAAAGGAAAAAGPAVAAVKAAEVGKSTAQSAADKVGEAGHGSGGDGD